MPKRYFKDPTSGIVKELDWNKPTPPTDADIEAAPEAVHPAETQATIPGMGQVPSQVGRVFDALQNPTRSAAPGPEKPPDWGLIRNPVTTALNKPIAQYTPDWVQKELATNSGTERTEPYDYKTPNYEEFPASERMWKGAARNVTPAHLAAIASLPMGGTASLLGNAALGLGGAVKIVDPSLQKSERVQGGIETLMGLAGAAGSVPKVGRQLGKAKEAYAAIPAGDATSSIRSAAELRNAALAAKTPEELALIRKELQLVDFQDKLAQGMVGPEATRLKGLKGANKAQFQAEASTAKSEVAAAKAAAKAQAEADKAASIEEYFNNLAGNTAEQKAAIERAKRISLAKSEEGLDAISAKAGTGQASVVDKPSYYVPPETKVKVPTKPPTKAPVDAASLQKEIDAQIAFTAAHTPAKPPSVNDVMFGAAEVPEPLKLDKPLSPNQQASLDKLKEGLNAKFSGQGPVTTPVEPTKPVGISETLPTKLPKVPRTEDVLRSNPRFQALSKEDRAARYKELGGVDAEFKKLDKPDIDPSTLYSGLNPELLKAAYKKPWARAGIGATIGSTASDDDNKGTNAVLGGIAGVLAAPAKYKGMAEGPRWLQSAMYEGLLGGAPQVSNLAGTMGGSLAAVPMEAMRGNIQGSKDLIKYLMHPGQVGKKLGSEFLQSWKSKAPITRMGKSIEAVGPSGKTLRAVDKATIENLKAGGVDEALAGRYTLGSDPSTPPALAIQNLIDKLGPVGAAVTPFSRTQLNALEMAAATSPLRWRSPAAKAIAGGATGYAVAPEGDTPEETSKNRLQSSIVGTGLGVLAGKSGKNLRKLLPTQDYVTKGGIKIPAAVFEALLGIPAPLAAAAGYKGYGPTSVPGMALLGPYAAPYIAGKSVRDYQKYGRDDPRDVTRSLFSNVPGAGDLPHLFDDPLKWASSIPSRFIPQATMMFGDKTVREPAGPEGALFQGVEGAIREKIPGWRESLPAKVGPLGDELKRSKVLGLYPEAEYDTNPIMKRLSAANPSLLRREPSGSLGGISPQEELKTYARDKGLETLDPNSAKAVKELLDKITPAGNTKLTPFEETDLKKLRGKGMEAMLGPFISSPEFTKLDPKLQDIFLKIYKGMGSEIGTEVFKANRMKAAAEKYKNTK